MSKETGKEKILEFPGVYMTDGYDDQFVKKFGDYEVPYETGESPQNRYSMRIISEEQVDYFRKIVRYYTYEGLDDMNCANIILRQLEIAGAEFGEFDLSYEYDHCDYKGARKYDNYEGFLKNGGLLNSLNELSDFNFMFTFDDVKMVGHISQSGLILESPCKSTETERRDAAQKVFDKIRDIVKEVSMYI